MKTALRHIKARPAPPRPRREMNHRDLIRLSLLLVILGLNAVLSHYAFKDYTGSPVLGSVALGAYAVLVIAAVLLLQACFCGRAAHQSKHPRLSFENVIVHVYGLGLIIFATVYCITGVSGDATAYFFLVMTGIGIDDMLSRTRDATLRRSLLFLCALLAGVSNICSALTVKGAGETVQAVVDQQWFSVSYGIVLPVSVPWVYFAVRGKRFYNPVTIYDFLHFGMPFAVILSATALTALTLVEHRAPSPLNASLTAANATDDGRLVTAADVATPLLCLNMLPTVFLAIQSTLLYSTVDFLSVSAVVAAFKALAEREPSTLIIVSFVSASFAFSLRVYACYRDENDKCSVAYAKESEEDEEEDQILEKMRLDIETTSV